MRHSLWLSDPQFLVFGPNYKRNYHVNHLCVGMRTLQTIWNEGEPDSCFMETRKCNKQAVIAPERCKRFITGKQLQYPETYPVVPHWQWLLSNISKVSFCCWTQFNLNFFFFLPFTHLNEYPLHAFYSKWWQVELVNVNNVNYDAHM